MVVMSFRSVAFTAAAGAHEAWNRAALWCLPAIAEDAARLADASAVHSRPKRGQESIG
jgi:hypothetical protein